jgi:protease-4
VVRSGPLKGAASGFAPLADNERALLQGLIDEAYEQFVGIVAEGRRMERARVKEIADGRVYSGNQALRLGLIDEIGDLPEAIERAAVLANLPPKPRVVQEHPRSLLEELLSFRAIGQPRPSTALGLTSDPIAPLQYLYLGR